MSFEQYIRSIVSDNKSALKMESIMGRFTLKILKKGGYFVREGDVCRYFCYIESGILHHSIAVDGQEKTTYLALRGSATSSLDSFLNKKPSRKDVRALTDCNLWCIDLDNFEELCRTNTLFFEFYHKLLERQICLIDEYRIDLLTLTPEERYQKLLQTETKLLQQVPLHYLASFLGISQRHMSRIRRSVK